MNPDTYYDYCDACGIPNDEWVILRDMTMDGAEVFCCYSCARYFSERDDANNPRWQTVGATSVRKTTPYDQASAQYHAEVEALNEQERRLKDNIALNAALEPLLVDPDVVLDEYNEQRAMLARVCGNIVPVVSYGNTYSEADGYAQWRDLRQSAIGG